MIQIWTNSFCFFSSPSLAIFSSLLPLESYVRVRVCVCWCKHSRFPPNKQEISLQSQQIRHRHRLSLVSTNYGPMLTVMDVISVLQHTHNDTHTHKHTTTHTHTNTHTTTHTHTMRHAHTRRFIFEVFNFYFFQSLSRHAHTHPLFHILFHIPPISPFFFLFFFFPLKDILSSFPLSPFSHAFPASACSPLPLAFFCSHRNSAV